MRGNRSLEVSMEISSAEEVDDEAGGMSDW